MKYVLSDRQQLTQEIMLLTLKPFNNQGLVFQPGQYAALRFKRHGRYTPARCFSIINRPNEAGQLQFAIKVSGKFTSALQKLSLSSIVDLVGVYGDFYYDPQYDKRSVMIAGGIGITPIISILRSAVHDNPGNKFTLIYSVRTETDAVFTQELLNIEAKHPNFRVIFALSDGHSSKLNPNHVLPRKINATLLASAARNDFENTSFFVCGPASLTDMVISSLHEHDTPLLRINTESFNQARAAKNSQGIRSVGQKLVSVYGLAAITFAVIIGTITATDIMAQTVAANKTSKTIPTTSTSTQAEDSTNAVQPTSTTNTAPASTATQTTPKTTQTYQQPVSSVS